jgi:hypothetical protein
MAKKTCFELVAEMLSAIGSDEVEAIDDTTEARQAYDQLKIAFDELVSSRQWEFRKQNFQLEAYTRAAQPTRFKIPDNISEIFYIKYDSKEIVYISPSDFQYISDGRDDTKPEVVSFVYDGAPVRVLNNHAPTYWTSFDDEVIFFDSFDVTVDTGGWMTAAKCFGYGLKDVCNWPDSSLADDFIPDLPDKFFPMLRAMARERAFFYLKQMDTPSDTRFVRKQKIHLNKTEARARRGTGVVPHMPDYGRRR